MDARDQSAVIVRELLVVLGVAAIAAVVAGVLVSVLTVPQLARAAVAGAYLVTPLSASWLGLGVLVGALIVGGAAILFDLSRRVRSLASRLLPSEEGE